MSGSRPLPCVTFEGADYPVRPGESVLEALVRGGASVPFSCRKGSCQVCLMKAARGDPGAPSRRDVRHELQQRGYFLPCQARPSGDLTAARPDPTELFIKARVHARDELAPGVVRLLLEPDTTMSWRGGQFINIHGPGGAVRSYSLASIPELDYFLEIHVRRTPGGAVSPWLCDALREGDELELQGPLGNCSYQGGREDEPLLLIGAGTGLSPLVGIARDALRSGHRGPVFLYHGSSRAEGLYLAETLRALAVEHDRFHYTQCLSGHVERDGAASGRATDVAFSRHPDLRGFRVYLCGPPAMVYDARWRAFRAGADRADIFADPFENSRAYMPDDAAKLAALRPDPELWEALGQGALLTEILTEFYGRVYADPRLSPFFHGVTKERAIEKQYSFLRDVFSGSKGYFGLRPFNAHHWMVISDELFDYREALLEGCMRRCGLPEHLVRRWGAVHELFRREIVKSSARGLILDGVEQLHEGHEELTLEVASICDGCEAEMPSGVRGRFHLQTGKRFCGACGAREARPTLQAAPA